MSRESRATSTLIEVGTVRIGGPEFVVTAGTRAVENRDQLLSTAEAVAASGAALLRGGAFKPRTSPYASQGLDEDGLALLAEARRRTGLPIITEVMQPCEVAQVAHFADILQIGARNMQNFPLLKEVGRSTRPVMLKRGLCATIDEWRSHLPVIVDPVTRLGTVTWLNR